MKKCKLVEVMWIDSSFSAGWKTRSTYSAPEMCRTVGYLTHKDKKCVNVSMNLSSESRSETMAIPRANVKSIRKVR